MAGDENGGKGKGRDSVSKFTSARLSLSGKGEVARNSGGRPGMMRMEVKGAGGDKPGKGSKKDELMTTRSRSGKK